MLTYSASDAHGDVRICIGLGHQCIFTEGGRHTVLDGAAISRVSNGANLVARVSGASFKEVYAAQSLYTSRHNVALGTHTFLEDDGVRELASSLGLIASPTEQEYVRCKALNILDSGAGVDCLNSKKYAIPGSVRVNTTSIATANGVIVPPTKCDARIPVRTSYGKRMHLMLRDALIYCPTVSTTL